MTALNLLCQGDAAYMLTDAAVTDLNGLLLSTRPKALLLKRARMAICWTGFAPMPAGGARAATNAAGMRLKAALRAQGVEPDQATQSAIMAALPGALRTMHIENITSMPGATQEMTSISVGVALWSEAGGPMMVIGQTEPMGGLAAYSFSRVRYYLSVDEGDDATSLLGKALGRSADLSDPVSFDVRRDGLSLLESQRMIRRSYSGLTHHGIGGRAILIKVSRNGVAETVLRRWQDKIGKPIVPENSLNL